LRVLVLGASGMLGNAMVRIMYEKEGIEVYGTVRSFGVRSLFSETIARNIITGFDATDHDGLIKLLIDLKPDVIINCIGLIKQVVDVKDPLIALPINAILPHRLARLSALIGARLVHISTDCVFSGIKGNYIESDIPDAKDLYGKSKYLGEVDYLHTVTLRTSIIGHELQSAHGLIEWFLSQKQQCKGYKKAIFSGLPTVALAQIIRDFVIPNPTLSGVYHVAVEPISKYDLLSLVADVYGKAINIVPDNHLVINRSLNAERFKQATGYTAPKWPELIKLMHSYQ
jgi:dTDP-4-dehydrorhamnose reductase